MVRQETIEISEQRNAVKSIKSTFPVAIVTVFSTFFVTDEAGGISARNVLQTFEHCDWCAGIF